jgi:uncharacterized membrane protein YqiK
MAKIFVNVDGVDIEAKGEVLREVLDFQAKCKAEADAKLAEAEAKAEAKTALLERLGITEDEAKLLLS